MDLLGCQKIFLGIYIHEVNNAYNGKFTDNICNCPKKFRYDR